MASVCRECGGGRALTGNPLSLSIHRFSFWGDGDGCRGCRLVIGRPGAVRGAKLASVVGCRRSGGGVRQPLGVQPDGADARGVSVNGRQWRQLSHQASVRG